MTENDLTPQRTVHVLTDLQRRGLTTEQFHSIHHWGEDPVGRKRATIEAQMRHCRRIASFSPTDQLDVDVLRRLLAVQAHLDGLAQKPTEADWSAALLAARDQYPIERPNPQAPPVRVPRARKRGAPRRNREDRLLELYDAGQRNFHGWRLPDACMPVLNISGADLRGAHLERANLAHANLTNARLKSAQLEEADLRGATIAGADLSGANLNSADLREANLDGASLSQASLANARLEGASLIGTVLGHADLSRANLQEANLDRADLGGARLLRANLEGVRLTGANLHRAELSFASMRKANLSRADLGEADLAGADLEGAIAGRANFSFSILRGAKLVNAALPGANLHKCDLSGASGVGVRLGDTVLTAIDLAALVDADVVAPCAIDSEAVARSLKSNGLEKFLRRASAVAGVATPLVAWARALDPKGLFAMTHSVFISYGAPDEAFAQRLREALETRGVKTWFFKLDAVPGEKLHRTMWDGVNRHDRMLLVCSKASLSRKGVWNEIERALEREAREGGTAVVMPIRLDEHIFSDEWIPTGREDLAVQLKDRVIADFRGVEAPERFAEAVEKVVNALLLSEARSGGAAGTANASVPKRAGEKSQKKKQPSSSARKKKPKTKGGRKPRNKGK